MIMRSIIKWCDNKMDEAIVEEDERKSMHKATASGFVEGFCDGALLMYVPLVVACFVYQAMLAKK